MPELQYDVWHDGRLVATVDFVWHAQRLIGEFDGRVKYGRLLRPGEEPGDAVWREKQREDLVRRLTGYRVVRFTWADLERPGVTAAVLRAALADAAA